MLLIKIKIRFGVHSASDENIQQKTVTYNLYICMFNFNWNHAFLLSLLYMVVLPIYCSIHGILFDCKSVTYLIIIWR